MRENIGLFRGKRIDNGEWVEGFYHRVTNNWTHKNVHYITCFQDMPLTGETILTVQHEVIPDTIGECTGLRDKNGKLIFEGDIIHTLYANCPRNELVEEVVFFDGSFMARKYSLYAKIAGTESPKHFEFDKSVYMVECEVIGNIHDTPELMKEGADE